MLFPPHAPRKPLGNSLIMLTAHPDNLNEYLLPEILSCNVIIIKSFYIDKVIVKINGK
jgi:hypothetical protein